MTGVAMAWVGFSCNLPMMKYLFKRLSIYWTQVYDFSNCPSMVRAYIILLLVPVAVMTTSAIFILLQEKVVMVTGP